LCMQIDPDQAWAQCQRAILYHAVIQLSGAS